MERSRALAEKPARIRMTPTRIATDLGYSWKDKVLWIPNDTDVGQPDNVEELTAWLVGKAVKSGVNEVREAALTAQGIVQHFTQMKTVLLTSIRGCNDLRS
jgi:hypothetical protein